MDLIKGGGVINSNSDTSFGGENSYCPGGLTANGGCPVTYSGNTGTTGSSNPANNPGGSYESSNPGGGAVTPGGTGSTLSAQTVYTAETLNPYTPPSTLALGFLQAYWEYLLLGAVAIAAVVILAVMI